MRKARVVLLLLSCAGRWSYAFADQKEEPVGLVLSAKGAQLLRAATETPLAARAGDLLFEGDGLRTAADPASFLFCPAAAIETLTPSGEVRLEAKRPKVKTGRISEQPARACALPATLRVAVASQQHYGVTMTRGTNLEVAPVPRAQWGAGVEAEVAPLEAELAAKPADPAALVGEANIFEKHNLTANALDLYYKVREQWPDAVWIKSKIFELEEAVAAKAAPPPSPEGKTYALLIGISKYKKPELALQFADADAGGLGKLLETPLGGTVPASQMLVLTNEQATTAAVRNGFQDFLKRRAGKNDTVVILVAGHGTVEVPGTKSAFILTYDSDPQDLTSTALPMAELRTLFEEQLTKVAHVLLFVDVCKAGTIGSIQNTTVSADVQHLGDVEGDLFGFLASRPKEVSLEGPQFGGGHGVFSYFLLKGLAGAADENKDGVVDASELIQYVSAQVPAATNNKQHPREFGTYENSMKLSDAKKPGIPITHLRILLDSRSGEPLYLASTEQDGAGGQAPSGPAAQADADVRKFEAAIQGNRLLADRPDNAFAALQTLQGEVNPERYAEAQNQLRIALENRAQEVLLRYLAGDQMRQSEQDFVDGRLYMEAARTLTRESLYLEGRQDFFDGRALLFEKNFLQAAAQLEQSVRIDPGAAYGYNALGIAYLEQGRFNQAIPAFRDAARRAQHWSYPLHNLALAYTEAGDFSAAIRTYQQAMRLTPDYSYLPYNLGLVYQRVNRKKDAESAYRKALMLAPNTPEPYNGLGTLLASESKFTEAERLYRDALQRDSQFLPARHNLALLLARDKNRRPEALDLWRTNLVQSPDYLPSLLSLAGTLAEDGDHAGAIEQYRKVLALQSGYIAARQAIGKELLQTGNADGAIGELREALKSDAQNPALLEQIGDIEASRNRGAEARTAYQSALDLAPDRTTRNRLNGKLKALPK